MKSMDHLQESQKLSKIELAETVGGQKRPKSIPKWLWDSVQPLKYWGDAVECAAPAFSWGRVR